MLAVLVHIANMARRALRKTGRAALLLAQAWREAQEARRTLPRTWVEE